ncbi:hypothetical protein GCM10010361_11370 [Streptomyces olivaceiscleroticus]|uniref:Integrase n=1 Tax=Streptomyces olivaceiscleroticus TaxID=68245 RepID=A0ABN0ZIL1_9ACTN
MAPGASPRARAGDGTGVTSNPLVCDLTGGRPHDRPPADLPREPAFPFFAADAGQRQACKVFRDPHGRVPQLEGQRWSAGDRCAPDVAEWTGHKSLDITFKVIRCLMPGSLGEAAEILELGLTA